MTEKKSSGREQRAGGKRRSRQGFARIATCVRFQRSRGGVLVFFFLRGAPQNAARKPHAENAYRSKAAPPALVKHFFQNCQKMAAFYKQPPKWRVGFMHEVYSIIKRELVFRKSQAGESFKTLESMANIRFYYIVIGSAQVCATSFI